MPSLNKVTLIGHLGKDPHVIISQTGQKVVHLSLATSESWKDKQTGEFKSETQWHKIVIFNERLAEVCEKFMKKGSRVFVEGKLTTNTWTDQNGQIHQTPEIVLTKYKGEVLVLVQNNDNKQLNNNAPSLSDRFHDDIPF